MTATAGNGARTTQELARAAVAHTLRPMSAQDEIASDTLPSIISQGEGVYITDRDGRRMLDCVGGLWCVNAGYGRTEIIDAMTQSLHRLAYMSSFPGSATLPAIELSERLCEIGAVEDIARVLFGSNGSDAVENALKIARQYWKILGRAEKVKFLFLRGAYHGTHFGGMAANGLDPVFRRSYEPMLPGFFGVETFNSYRPLLDLDPERQVDLCLALMEREIIYQGAETIAALIAEPVQGGGGMHIPPPRYWQGLRALCDRHDILLIADEVVTGFGRTGATFGSRGWGVKPDIMCCGKGISGGYAPLSATLLNRRVADAWNEPGDHSFVAAGYTHGGNPTSCSAGLAALAIVEREGLAENAASVGAYFLDRLRQLIDRHEAVGDVRGKGLMLCLENVKDADAKLAFDDDEDFPARIAAFCRDHGVWLRQSGHKFIISPPLTFTREHVDIAVDVLDQAYRATPIRSNSN